MTEADRLRWQCRRGMRELDILLTRYLDDDYERADAEQKRAFQEFLTLPDPQLVAYLLQGQVPEEAARQRVVEQILLRAGS